MIKVHPNDRHILPILAAERGLPADATGADVEAHATAEFLHRLREELETDPTGLGFKGANNEQVAFLLNRPYDPRSHHVLAGIPYAPNLITAEHVAAARGRK